MRERIFLQENIRGITEMIYTNSSINKSIVENTIREEKKIIENA